MDSAKNHGNPGFVIEENHDSNIRNPLQAMVIALKEIRKHAAGRNDAFTLTFVSMAERALQMLAANVLQQTQAKVERVLIVEDDVDIGTMLSTIVETNGLEYRLVTNGKDALEAVSQFNPDVIVLDMGLPAMSGFEVAGRLRSGGFQKKIIAFTGFASQADRGRGNLVGINQYLVKPADPEKLIVAILGE